MFRRLPAAPKLDDGTLNALAEQMREAPPADAGAPTGWGSPGAPPADLDNEAIPAAYTYFGQFVDHDITFDPASSFQRDNDPDALRDFRTPRFDLDSVYGSGPADEPFQYESDGSGKLLVGSSNDQPDLPRNSQGIALIGDPRNDENIIVSQLQLVFLRFHNKMLDEVNADASVPAEVKFETTQQRVRWHYQWVLVNDFLRRLIGKALLDQLFPRDETSGEHEFHLRYFKPKKNAFMPVEFSVAAYRYGHSQVRPAYHLNTAVRDKPIFVAGDAVGELDDLRGGRALPGQWALDWNLFLPLDGSSPQPSRKIDSHISPGLFDLPHLAAGDVQSLAARNLKRGESFGLPSGQDVARALRVPKVLSGADLGGAPEATPLWFYILKESELTPADGNGPVGQQLGPVGGRIVAEVLLGLLHLDPDSFPNAAPGWTPTVPIANAELGLTLGDVVKYATG